MNGHSANGQSAIVIVVDRLGAGFLGPYGNTWIETPAFNRLASQSLLWENAFATAPTSRGAYEAIGAGQHPLAASSGQSPRLWDLLQSVVPHTALLTDDPQLSTLSQADSLTERVVIESRAVAKAAKSLEQTRLGQLFLAAAEWMTKAPRSFCLVIHSQGMAGPWDAPREFRQQCADEDDPPVPDFIEPPHRSLGADADPDEILGINQAYGGQVIALDHCLHMLLEVLTERGLLDSTLLVLTSPRGFPLGEHAGRIGDCGDHLHEELLHVPLLIRRPDQRHAMVRCHTLSELTDIYATLAAWFQVPIPAIAQVSMSLLEPTQPGGEVIRECVVAALGAEESLRTPAWFLVRSPGEPLQLYAKPDDRWEINQVADRCGETATELAAVLDEFVRQARSGQPIRVGPLPDHLLRRID